MMRVWPKKELHSIHKQHGMCFALRGAAIEGLLNDGADFRCGSRPVPRAPATGERSARGPTRASGGGPGIWKPGELGT